MEKIEIKSFFKQSEDIEEMYVTQLDFKGNSYTLASYVYNGELAKDETNPSFWNTDEFNELEENIQQKIRDLVNKNLLNQLK